MMRIERHVFKLQSIDEVGFLFPTHFIRFMPGLQYCKNNSEKGPLRSQARDLYDEMPIKYCRA